MIHKAKDAAELKEAAIKVLSLFYGTTPLFCMRFRDYFSCFLSRHYSLVGQMKAQHDCLVSCL